MAALSESDLGDFEVIVVSSLLVFEGGDRVV
jgi:hypothetical protein